MKCKTFRHGVHPRGYKELSAGAAIRRMELPTGQEAIYPLSQHIGAPAVPIVAVGDRVLAGQKLAEPSGMVSAGIHAAFSGRVKAIEPRTAAGGETTPCIVLETDEDTAWIDPAFDPASPEAYAPAAVAAYMASPAPSALTAEGIRTAVREAGIVGLGGAGFPSAVKLSPREPDRIDHLIINGAECEPYLTSDHRLMLERGEALVAGCQLLLRLFPQAVCAIAVENNKPDAIAHLQEIIASTGDDRLSVCPLKAKYPQGGERMLIRAVTGRYLHSKLLPADVGCVVINAASTIACFYAISRGQPLTHRIMTVTGDAVKSPCNIEVPLGVTYAQVLAAAGGFAVEPEKVVSGGPMMGHALFTLDIPVTKTSASILAMREDPMARQDSAPCIHCGRCLQACPEGLVPQLLAAAADRNDFETFEKRGGMECIECGSCAYVCPSGRHLVQSMRYGRRKTGGILRTRAAEKPAKGGSDQ